MFDQKLLVGRVDDGRPDEGYDASLHKARDPRERGGGQLTAMTPDLAARLRLGVDEQRARARLRSVDGRCQPGRAAADHHDLGLERLLGAGPPPGLCGSVVAGSDRWRRVGRC